MEIEEDKKIFRSLIKKYFPVDLLIKLNEITMARDIDNNSKTAEILEAMDQFNVPYSKLGNGTNRYGCLIEGYAVKIALDKAGKTDNKREMKYAKALYPSVVKVYECLEDGLVAVFEYVTIFSLNEFYDYQDKMRKILKDITENYLVGDIGISKNNYVNWGIRNNGEVVILDFAYIYALSYKNFLCTCEEEGTLEFDNDYNYLVCPYCNKKWEFLDIRRRVTKEDEIAEIGDVKEYGYILHSEEEELPVDSRFSVGKKSKKKKEKKMKSKGEVKPKKPEEEMNKEDFLRQINSILIGG